MPIDADRGIALYIRYDIYIILYLPPSLSYYKIKY